MTEPDQLEESDDWHFGLFLHQQYLQQQADKVMEELVNIKQLIHYVKDSKKPVAQTTGLILLRS